MKNLWDDAEAERVVKAQAEKGVPRDLALRVYTTRLLGGEPRLVLHGGGNTSLKTTATDILDEEWQVLCVKGSGWDMGVIEAPGLPAVKLAPLLKARRLDALSDEDMVALQRANLIDPASPNPSIETLLHAFLPHKFVDHTHSTAILALVDQNDSEEVCRKLFGKRMGFVPYIKPGFDLAKAAAEVYDADPSVEGLILDKHGIFTFAEDARTAYSLMIEFVTMAEEHVAKSGKEPFAQVKLPDDIASAAEIAPLLRGAVAVAKGEGRYDRMVSEFRSSEAIMAFANAESAEDLSLRGVSTPDLSIRIKTGPLVLPAPEAGKLDGYRAVIEERVAAFSDRYRAYFEENDGRDEVSRTMLDPMPRLTFVRGVGMFGHGRSMKEARIAADVGEMLIEAIKGAEAIGSFRPLPLSDLFELEYWSLEQAKLAANKPKPLSGQVVLVTGGAGAIGAATAKLFASQGAHVVVADLDGRQGRRGRQAGRQRLDRGCLRRHRPGFRARRVRQRGRGLRRGRHRHLQRRGRLAGQDRRARRRDAQEKLRAQFLRPPVGGAERGARLFHAGHRRRASVQHLQAGGEPRRQFRRLRPAEGGNAVPVAAIRAGIRRDRRALQRRQCRPHPLGPADRRHDRQPLEGARRLGGRLHGRQPARAGGDGRARRTGLPRRGVGRAHHGRRHDGRRRQYRRSTQVNGRRAMKVGDRHYRSIWPASDGTAVEVIDQRRLPHEFSVERIDTVEGIAAAIKDMWVRGAPLIGVAAAYGVAVRMAKDPSDAALDDVWEVLHATRPTAINLRWALDDLRALLRPLPEAERAEAAWKRAGEIADEDVELNRSIGRNGLAVIRDIAARKKPGEPVNILTHCNAGWLATVDYGTATSPIYLATEAGIPVHVFVDETRPRNQGAHLTAWEMAGHGVPHTLIVDNAGGHLMQRGAIDMVIVGTDRTTAEGDVCNKIGTYLKALAAHDNGVPFYVALPSPTIDWTVSDGVAEIPIEERDPRRGVAGVGPHGRRRGDAGAHLARRHAGRQSRLRRHAGAAGHRADHRARHRQGLARGAGEAVSRTGEKGGLIPVAGNPRQRIGVGSFRRGAAAFPRPSRGGCRGEARRVGSSRKGAHLLIAAQIPASEHRPRLPHPSRRFAPVHPPLEGEGFAGIAACPNLFIATPGFSFRSRFASPLRG